MKPVVFKFTAQKDIKAFPEGARRKAGQELMAVQMGMDPIEWKPMPSIGAGVKELKIHENGEFRVVFIAKFPEAVYVFIRSRLMLEIRKYIQENKMTQKEASLKMGVTQPRISDLMRGKIDLFTIDMLVSMLEKIGIDVEVSLSRAA
ncbi:MAG: XRE family transcriptional regulator [Desulfobacteraceae bacterium]|nr:XRE family transcriptional regulator [Desulfobacteraceae bacterium]